jgi:hypothetical protein
MSITRNNHYVAQWYQEEFFEGGRTTLAYLDMTPPQRTLSGGRVITERSLFDAPTSRAFRQMDLYSTFFGTSINDEIERRLFGDIDAKGSNAVRAYAGTNVDEWMRHFQILFEYIDIQKIRTPKGLEWLRAQYPSLTQNELMFEMQGSRMMHCTRPSPCRSVVTCGPMSSHRMMAARRVFVSSATTGAVLTAATCLVMVTSPRTWRRTDGRSARNSPVRGGCTALHG